MDLCHTAYRHARCHTAGAKGSECISSIPQRLSFKEESQTCSLNQTYSKARDTLTRFARYGVTACHTAEVLSYRRPTKSVECISNLPLKSVSNSEKNTLLQKCKNIINIFTFYILHFTLFAPLHKQGGRV